MARPQRLDVGGHTEFPEPRDVGRIECLYVCELVQRRPPPVHLPRRLETIERHSRRLVADDVDMDLEAGGVEGDEEFAQMVLAEHHRRVAALGIRIVGKHRRRAVLHDAVEEEFRRMHLQHRRTVLVAESLEFADDFADLVLRPHQRGRGHANGEFATLVEPAVDIEVALLDEGIENAGNSVAVAQCLAEPDASREIVVGACRQSIANKVYRGLVDEAGGRSVSGAHERTVERISGGGIDAERGEATAVHRRVVTVGSEDETWPVGHRPVEQMAVEVVFAEHAGIPADAM